jgi:NDP-sugar pyrophosphorylase family protein
MSGFGERFRRANYKVPKPLIEIDGKPIIAHVIDMFPGEQNFIFICNQEHLDNPEFEMASILRKYCPTGKIVGIPPHKLGPVHALLQIEQLIDPSGQVMVSYCDFTCYWNWDHFKEFVSANACIGAIPAYKGFHPHSLGKTNYAYLLEADGWIRDIQEKQPFTNSRMDEFASTGAYYFSSGKIMWTALRQAMDQNLNVAGEYYVSLAYKTLLRVNRSIAVYPIQHFMQWGTPEDVAEYRGWSAAFRRLITAKSVKLPSPGALILPMAGMGQRFADEGYTITKPLIPVSGRPMVAQATQDLPPAASMVFILRGDMPGHRDISSTLKILYPAAIIVTIPRVTEGQACTALLGLDALGPVSGPVTIGTCDSGVLYDALEFEKTVENLDIDVIVWGVRGHANAMRNPGMFGWINAQNGWIKSVSVKAPLECPETDPIVIGTFTFRNAEIARCVIDRLIDRNGRVNGEFYLDSSINDAIELGLRCYFFEVDSFLSWGTPNDLQTFEYWQSCFHKWSGHPYRLELDAHVDSNGMSALEDRWRWTFPNISKVTDQALEWK